jgi:hypothetical protein
VGKTPRRVCSHFPVKNGGPKGIGFNYRFWSTESGKVVFIVTICFSPLCAVFHGLLCHYLAAKIRPFFFKNNNNNNNN